MKIQCQVIDQTGADELEVDENFRLWPCCYVNSESSRRIGFGETQPGDNFVDNFIDKFPKDWNSLKHHSWKEIIEHPIFAVHFNEEHWNDPEQCSHICERECSTGKNFIEMEMFHSDHQYGNKLVGKKAGLYARENEPPEKEKLGSWKDIPTIDFGITSHCNAGCSGCARTNNDTRKAYEWLELKHVDADNLIKYISEAYNFFPSLTNIKLCGDRGDPMMHPRIEFLIDTLCKDNQHAKRNLNLKINTNGSLRNPDFYEKIADYKNMTLTWSIDGFEETNHVYRYGCDFDKIWDNFTTFCKTGGGSNANWDFLVFKHNWHEIPRVKEEATKLNVNSLDFKIVRQGVHWGLNRIAIVESIDDDDVEKVKKLIDEDTLSNT